MNDKFESFNSSDVDIFSDRQCIGQAHAQFCAVEVKCVGSH